MSNSNRQSSLGNESDVHVRTPAIILTLIIGFSGIIFISFFAHWYEVVIMESAPPQQIIVNAIPPIVMFMMLMVVLALNPLFRLISLSLVLGSRELLMILSLWLITSVICYSNFMMPFLMSVGNVNSTLDEAPVVARVALRDHLNYQLYLPTHAADEYYMGKSPDGRTRVPPFAGTIFFRARDFRNIGAFAVRVREEDDAISRYLRFNISAEALDALRRLADVTHSLSDKMVEELNALIEGPLIYDEETFEHVPITAGMRHAIDIADNEQRIIRLNRRLLEAAYPGHIDDKPTGDEVKFTADDFRDITGLASEIYQAHDAVSLMIRDRMDGDALKTIEEYLSAVDAAIPLQTADLNRLIAGPLLLEEKGLHGISLSGSAAALMNRTLLEAIYPNEIGISATPVSWPFDAGELEDPMGLAARIERGDDTVSRYMRGRFSEETLTLAARVSEGLSEKEKGQLIDNLLADLNSVVRGELIYRPDSFEGLKLEESRRYLLNRTLLQEGYSRELTRYASAIPWSFWFQRFAFWGPLIALVLLFSISLVRMMHRQWSEHELLTYPIATVMDTFLQREPGRLLPDAFRSRIFWVAFVSIFFVYLINGLHLYYPLMIRIPILFDHRDLIREFEFLARYSGREAYALFRGFLYPFVISLAVFLPTDLSLTSWLGWVIMVFITGFYFLFTGDSITEPDFGGIWTGMYIVLAIVILMIGRREYGNILKHAVTFRKSEDDVMNRAAWACRLFMLSFAGLVIMFTIAGVDWFISIVVVMSFGLFVLLVARLTAETGIPWLVNMRALSTVMPLRLLGAAVIGPQSLAVMSTVVWPLDVETSNSIPAQETTYIKNREKHGGGWLTKTRFNLIFVGGIVVALCATTFFHLWNNYTYGSRRERAMYYRVSDGMRDAASQIERLQIEGVYDQSASAAGLGKLANFQFNQRFWSFFAAGGAVVLLCALMRLRFSWWPFHPLPLLFVNTWAMSRLYTSIFLGWLIKTAILRIWGGKTFTNMKPFFLGIILGQAAILFVWVIVGTIYFLTRDMTPERLIYMWL